MLCWKSRKKQAIGTAVMDEFRKQYPDREAPDYQEKVKKAGSQIAQIYNSGTEYQAVIVQELIELFSKMVQRVV
jgi:hypothetical protein